MDEPVDNLAIGYTPGPDGWRNNLYLHVIRGGPAGGGFATAPDLHRFARALTEASGSGFRRPTDGSASVARTATVSAKDTAGVRRE